MSGINEMMIVRDLKMLLDLFEPYVPDKESNRLVWKFCDERHRWPKAHGLHSTIRDRANRAARKGEKTSEIQYLFEEVVAKTLFNLTKPSAPFDPDSPYWVLRNAVTLAQATGISPERLLDELSIQGTTR